MYFERGNSFASESVMVSVAWTYFDLDGSCGSCALATGTIFCGERRGRIESSSSLMMLGRGFDGLGERCSKLLIECSFLILFLGI